MGIIDRLIDGLSNSYLIIEKDKPEIHEHKHIHLHLEHAEDERIKKLLQNNRSIEDF